MTRIDSFAHCDARVVANFPVELIVPYIQRGYFARAVLQQTVGKSARRCADVQTRKSTDIEVEFKQCCFQLNSTAADITLRRSFFDSNVCVLRKEFGRLVDELLVN